jgi:hypothetical protein
MKKITLIFLGIVLVLLGANSCKKVAINGDSKTLVSGSYITLDSIISESLDFSNQAATVSIKVGSKGSPVASVNIFVATGSNALDTTGWVLIKNVPYSDGVVLSVSTAELAAALAPAVITPGNSYVLQNQVVTKDGRTFSVSNTPSTYNSFPAYNMALTWGATAVCAFDQATSVGNYTVVSDAFWNDFAPGDVLTVSAGANPNQLSLIAYPNPSAAGINRQPIIINVDPVTDIATVAVQPVGAYSNWPYGTLSVQTVGTSNFVFSCTGVIELTFDFTVAAGDFGNGSLILQHQ